MSAIGTGGPAAGAAGRTLEREDELSATRWVLGEAGSGRGARLVIEGPAGIGKSRLLEEARALASEAEVEVLHARGGELEREYPFGVVIRLLESRFARASPSARRRLFRGRAALAAPLLSARGGEDVSPAATADEFALVHGLYWCVVNLSEERPVALLVDDVHWADDLSLRFLLYLAERLEDLPVALVVAIRTGDPTAASELVTRLGGAGSRPPLRPAQLSQGAVRDLFASTLPVVAGDEGFVRASWQVTGGNPFLVHELLAAIAREPEAWSTLDPAGLEAFAPESVGRSVVLRLARLGLDALGLARACAVLGDESPLAAAARLAGLEFAVAIDVAERLAAAQIIAGVDPVSFAHPMIRSAVYAELGLGERGRLHLAAARVLHHEGAAAERVADHLLAGTPSDERWVRDALHAAARAAARKGAPGTAARYLRHALEHCPPGERPGAMLVDLGLVEASVGERTSLAHFEEALALIDEPAEQSQALYALGQTQFRYGQYEQAARTFRRGADLFARRDRELWLGFEAAFFSPAVLVVSLRADAIRRLESLVASVPEQGPTSTAERALLALLAANRALTVPPAAQHATLARRALGSGALVGDLAAESMVANPAIFAWAGTTLTYPLTLLWCGYADEAQRAVEELLAVARERGDALAFAEGSYKRAIIMYARGRIADAMADAQAAIEGVERGSLAFGPIPHAMFANCLIERDRLDVAEAVLQTARPLADEAAVQNAWLHWAHGRVRLARSQADAALAEFLLIGEIARSYGIVNLAAVPWRSLAALATHAAGDHERALALADEELAVARAFGVPAQIGAALRARGIVEGGPAGMPMLAEAVAVLEDADAPLELAYALVDLGGAQRRAGRRVDCREPLRRAHDLAHQCGASALQEHARDELRASGLRPRRAALSGVDALTPSERRIAQLAADGHTNRNIAETLFLTKNTVGWHLRHIYRKLDVGSREALATILDERRPATPSRQRAGQTR
jgi:DNA-binding CsgD family transcriptional regulator/tetratricopeptide (TPR) repeat protein